MTPTFSALKRLAIQKGLSVCAPTVVVDESVFARLRITREPIQKVASALNQASKVLDLDPLYLPNPEQLSKDWRADLEAAVVVIPVSGDDAIESIRREALRIKPAKSDGSGSRDCAIWLTARRVHLADEGTTYFVTDNVEDFWSADRKGLHSALAAELGERTADFHILRSISELLKLLAERFDLELGPEDFDEPALSALGRELATIYAESAELFAPDVLLSSTTAVDQVKVLDSYLVEGVALARVDLVVRSVLSSPVRLGPGEAAHIVRFKVRGWLECSGAGTPVDVMLESAVFQDAEGVQAS